MYTIYKELMYSVGYMPNKPYKQRLPLACIILSIIIKKYISYKYKL